MATILSTSVSGLRAFQTALSTTSHNISNVETEGYSRQRVELENRVPRQLGNTFIGQGVVLNDINRVIDEFIVGNIREFSSSFNRLDIMDGFATRLENLIADEQGGLLPALDDFFNAMNDVANDPASSAPRVVLLGMAENLQSRFTSLSTEMQKMDQEVDDRISFEVGDVNALTTEIANINESILILSNSDNQPADLLDRRDVLLQKLSEKITVSVVEQNDGTLNVLAGTGQLLVTGSISMQLSVQPQSNQPDHLGIAISSNNSTVEITNNIIGGTLGGLLDYRNNVLGDAQNSLGRTAIALAESFNVVHRDGYDLNGNLGGDFFSAGAPQVLAETNNNAATGLPVASIVDVAALTVSDYRASFSAGNFTITRLSDNAVVAGPAAGPVFNNIDGVDYDFTGIGAVDGDAFLIRPTRLGAIDFQSIINNTDEIAAASPISSNRSVSNIGDVDIADEIVTDVTNPDLLNTVTITFNDPAGTFDVVDAVNGLLAAGVAYTSGMNITFNGWQATLNGSPLPGDVLTVEENTGASTDNRNALRLAELSNTQILDNGKSSYEQSYASMVSTVGTVTQQIKINKDVEDSLLTSVIQERESVSGVNLDEEAADLIRFQQAYQAAARAIQTAQTTFQALLQAI